MSTIKVDTIATRTGSGNITLSNNVASLTSAGAISGTNLTASGTLGVTGATTLAGTTVSSSTLNMSSSLLQFSGNISLPNVGSCLFRPVADTIAFGINNGQRVSVNQHGLLFGTDTSAANALDDYEEGQWTPNIQNQGSTSNWSTKKGDYIKIGRVVHCWFVCDHGNSNSGSGTAVLELLGLPFNVAVESTSGSTFALNSTQSVGMWSANPSSQIGNIFTAGSATQFLLYKGGTSAATQLTFVTGSFSYISTS